MHVSTNPIITFLVRIECLVTKILKSPKASKAIFVVPPTDPQSLGDAAMLSGTVQYLHRKGYEKIYLLNYGKEECWSDTCAPVDGEYYYQDLFTHNRPKAIRRINRLTKKIKNCIFIGADVLDGGYGDWHAETKLDLANILSHLGIQCSIVGFSFKSNASEGATKLFKNQPSTTSFSLRDPASHKRFVERTKRKAEGAADLAFLFTHSTPCLPQSASKWFAEQRKWNRTILGYNINAILPKFLSSIEFDAFVAIHIKIIDQLLRSHENLSILMIPHDSRAYDQNPLHCDEGANNRVISQLHPIYGDRIQNQRLPKNADEVASITDTIDIAISGRMHFAIACLRSGTPVICWEYQDKVTGLLRDIFDCRECILDLDLHNDIVKLSEILTTCLNNKDTLAKKIRAKTQIAISQAEKNLSSIPVKLG